MLVQPLFAGSLDIIGDIHGEYGALCTLLDRLGYDFNGFHSEGRRLVFVGDLVDRGPDSISVVRLVKRFIDKGIAQCVLGNHEFNILRKQHKHGNGWFYGQVETIRKDQKAASFSVLVESDQEREEILTFLASLPIVLERSDVRVVHAAWQDFAVERLRSLDCSAIEAYKMMKAEIEEKIAAEGIIEEEERELMHQNLNAVKNLTSGIEQRAKEKFYSGGKWRTIERYNWWEDYAGEQLVIFGHYWRRVSGDGVADSLKPSPPDPFKEKYGCFELLGPKKLCMCVDYSVGVRYEERGHAQMTGSTGTALAAIRLPEMQLFSDVGHIVDLVHSKGKEVELKSSVA